MFRVAYNVCSSLWFQRLVLAAVVVNTVLLAIDHYGIEEKKTLNDFLGYANIVLTAGFTVELTLKLVGQGVGAFVMNGMDVLDGFVVLTSLIEIGVQACRPRPTATPHGHAPRPRRTATPRQTLI